MISSNWARTPEQATKIIHPRKGTSQSCHCTLYSHNTHTILHALSQTAGGLGLSRLFWVRASSAKNPHTLQSWEKRGWAISSNWTRTTSPELSHWVSQSGNSFWILYPQIHSRNCNCNWARAASPELSHWELHNGNRSLGRAFESLYPPDTIPQCRKPSCNPELSHWELPTRNRSLGRAFESLHHPQRIPTHYNPGQSGGEPFPRTTSPELSHWEVPTRNPSLETAFESLYSVPPWYNATM